MIRASAILLLVGGCTAAPDSEAPPAGTSRVSYALDWDRSGLNLEDGAWSVTTDRGFTVRIEAGWLVSYALYLDPCPVASRGVIAEAVAGHSAVSDPSTLVAARVEDLTTFEAVDLGSVDFPAASYCDAIYLIARADSRAAPLPPGEDLDGLSLVLRGAYTAPGGEPVPFDWETSIAHGASVPLDAPGTALRVEAVRAPAHWFDGIELAVEPADRVLRDVLINLSNHTELRVTAAD